MTYWIYIVLLLLNFSTLCAQTRVEGRVLDAESSEPIAYAHVILKGTETGTITDRQGYFSLEIPSLPAVLVVSEVAHLTRYVRMLEKEAEIFLEPFSFELEEITLQDEGQPYFRMANHVLDYDFYDDHILILGNSGREVRLIDYRGRIIDRKSTPGKFEEVFKDCLNNLHLVGEDITWQVYYDYEDIRFIHQHARPEFEQYLRNCRSRFSGGLIYSLSREQGLVTTFLFANMGETTPFYEIGDTSALDYRDSQYDQDYFTPESKHQNFRYAPSGKIFSREADYTGNTLPLDWMDARILKPSEYYVFSDHSELRVFSLGIMSEMRFDNLEKEPRREMLKIADTHLDFLTRDETEDHIYAVYKTGMGRAWALPLDNPADKLEINEFAFPSALKVRGNHLFFIVDPSIDGSNFLLRKNQKFGEADTEW